MQISRIHYLGSPEIKYTINGKNLYEMRRAELSKLASRLELPTRGKHHELLSVITHKLNILGAPDELTELHAFDETPDEAPDVGRGSEDVPVHGHDGVSDDRGGEKPKPKRAKTRRSKPAATKRRKRSTKASK